MGKKAHSKKGFTLIEILIASAVLSLLLMVGYKIFFGMSRSFEKGSWALTTQNKLRNGLGFIREEMQKASYLTTVKISTTIVDVSKKFSLTSLDEIAAGTAANIAEWSICSPYIDGTTEGSEYFCQLHFDGNTLLYNKTRINDPGDPDEKEYTNYPVITNIASISIGVEEFDPGRIVSGTLVLLNVTVEHEDKNRFPNANVSAQTGAKVEVEVTRDL